MSARFCMCLLAVGASFALTAGSCIVSGSTVSAPVSSDTSDAVVLATGGVRSALPTSAALDARYALSQSSFAIDFRSDEPSGMLILVR